MSTQTLQRLVARVAKRAGIAGHIHPHLLRHAFLHYIARATNDVAIAQALAGHADISTTQIYMGEVPLDELANAVRHLRLTDDPDTRSIQTPSTPTQTGYAEPIQPQTPIGTGIAAEKHNRVTHKQEEGVEYRPASYANAGDTARHHTGTSLHTPTPPNPTDTERGGFEPPNPTAPTNPRIPFYRTFR